MNGRIHAFAVHSEVAGSDALRWGTLQLEVARRLSTLGFRVLVAECAPDAERCAPSDVGFAPLVEALARGETVTATYVRPARPDGNPFDYLPSGAWSGESWSDDQWIRAIDEQGVGDRLYELREEWKESYDFVLLRVGAGSAALRNVCLVLLADELSALAGSTTSELHDLVLFEEDLRRRRRLVPRTTARLLVVPVLLGDESDAAQHRNEVGILSPLFSPWLECGRASEAIAELRLRPDDSGLTETVARLIGQGLRWSKRVQEPFAVRTLVVATSDGAFRSAVRDFDCTTLVPVIPQLDVRAATSTRLGIAVVRRATDDDSSIAELIDELRPSCVVTLGPARSPTGAIDDGTVVLPKAARERSPAGLVRTLVPLTEAQAPARLMAANVSSVLRTVAVSSETERPDEVSAPDALSLAVLCSTRGCPWFSVLRVTSKDDDDPESFREVTGVLRSVLEASLV